MFLVQVGNPVDKKGRHDPANLLERKFLVKNILGYYMKKDIINADEQMQSLNQVKIKTDYGYLNGRRNIFQLFNAGLIIQKMSAKKEIDIVHALWGATTSLITVLFSKKPVVISLCGSDLIGSYTKDGRKTWNGRVSRLLSLLASLMADHIIVKSAFLKSQLWRILWHKTTIIPNGINPEKWYTLDKYECREKLGWNKTSKVILFFNGSGAYVKNQNFAEKVFAKVNERIPDASFVIAEHIPHEDLVFYYNAANVLLICSLHEGSNNSLKEAMACNLPIVSSNVGDAFERLNKVKNCYVLNGWEEEPFAEAICKILVSGERSNGRDHIEDLTLNAVACKIKMVYEKILSK